MKKIGDSYYMHISNIPDEFKGKFALGCVLWCAEDETFDIEKIQVMKVDVKNNTATFIESIDWDSATEPIVGDAYQFSLDTFEVKKIKSRIGYKKYWNEILSEYGLS